MSTIGRLMLLIGGDASDLGRESKKAKRHIGSIDASAKKLSGTLKAVGGILAGGLVARWGKQWIDAADQVGKFSQRVGLSTEFLTRMQHAAEQSGVTMQTFQMAMQRGQRRLAEFRNTGRGEAVPALELLGDEFKTAVKAGAGMEELLPKIADRLLEIEDSGLRTVIAMKLFDSEGVSLIQMMQNGSAGLRELAREADDLGRTLTKADTEAAAAFNDALDELWKSVQKPATALIKDLTPALTDFAKGARDFVETWGPEMAKVLGLIKDGWVGIASGIGSAFRALSDWVGMHRRFLEGFKASPMNTGLDAMRDGRPNPAQQARGFSTADAARRARGGPMAPRGAIAGFLEGLESGTLEAAPGSRIGDVGPPPLGLFEQLAASAREKLPEIQAATQQVLGGLAHVGAEIAGQVRGAIGTVGAAVEAMGAKTTPVVEDLGNLAVGTFQQVGAGIGAAFGQAVAYGQDARQVFAALMKSLLVSTLAALGQLAVQWVIASQTKKTIDAAEHTGRIGLTTAQAAAAAYAAYAGFPFVGPALGAAAAAAAISGTLKSAAGGFAAGTAAGATMGAATAGVPSLRVGGSVLEEGLVYAHAGERILNAAEVRRTTPTTALSGAGGGFSQHITFRIGDETLGEIVARALHRQLTIQGITP